MRRSEITKEVKQEYRSFERNMESLTDEPIWNWGTKECAIAASGITVLGGIITKGMNIQTWIGNDFNMLSYNPNSIFLYVPMSFAFLYYSWYKKDRVFTMIGVIGVLYTMLLAYGIITTYFAFDPII